MADNKTINGFQESYKNYYIQKALQLKITLQKPLIIHSF